MKPHFLALLFPVLLFSCNHEEKQGNNYQETEKRLRDSVGIYPDSLIFRENLVQFYRDSNQYAKAIEATREGILSKPQEPRLYDMLAILHFENEDTLAAIAAFEKAAELQPSPHALISLGTLYAQTKNDQALAIAQFLPLQYEKVEKEALFIKGLYFNATGKFKDAIARFDSALAISHTFMEAYREKAIALNQTGNTSAALEEITKAVTLQNNYEEGYYFQGKYLEKLSRNEEAREAYEKALLYAPDYIEAREALKKINQPK